MRSVLRRLGCGSTASLSVPVGFSSAHGVPARSDPTFACRRECHQPHRYGMVKKQELRRARSRRERGPAYSLSRAPPSRSAHRRCRCRGSHCCRATRWRPPLTALRPVALSVMVELCSRTVAFAPMARTPKLVPCSIRLSFTSAAASPLFGLVTFRPAAPLLDSVTPFRVALTEAPTGGEMAMPPTGVAVHRGVGDRQDPCWWSGWTKMPSVREILDDQILDDDGGGAQDAHAVESRCGCCCRRHRCSGRADALS